MEWNVFDIDRPATHPAEDQLVVCSAKGKSDREPNAKATWVAEFSDGDFYALDGIDDGDLIALVDDAEYEITHWIPLPAFPRKS